MEQKGFIQLVILLVVSIFAVSTVVTYSIVKNTPQSSPLTTVQSDTENPVSIPNPKSTPTPIKTVIPTTKPFLLTKTTTPKPYVTPTVKSTATPPTQTTTSIAPTSTTSIHIATTTPTSVATTSTPTPTTSSYVQATSCSSVTISGATNGGANLYYVSSGGIVTLSANTTPSNGIVNWKTVSFSSALPNGGSFSANGVTTVNYIAPINTSGSDQGVEIRGDISEYPNAWLYCPPLTIGVHSN